ncbi:MAG: hypothetical protein ACJAXB_002498, partial [Candidatus Endobugula sp.]
MARLAQRKVIGVPSHKIQSSDTYALRELFKTLAK